jgi:hypothetical protein
VHVWFHIGNDDDENSSWKLAVHALNVLRLILTDASLGPDLNAFVAETVQLAVSGFTAPQWAVRNSCMMVFTAVAQRAVGTDKNDSAGAAVPTISEFFQRFPALEPFLQSALTIATEYRDGVHPTLYPLLMLIAKLRVTVLEDAVSNEDEAVNRGATTNTIAALVDLVDRCGAQKVQAVRVIAGKALSVLTPVAVAIPTACERLARCATRLQTLPNKPDLNAVHGLLVGVRELVRSVCTYIQTNEFTSAELVASLRESVHSALLPRLEQVVEAVARVPCAALHIPLVEVARFVVTILRKSAEETQVAADVVLIKVCRGQLPAIFLAGQAAVTPRPFEPWLWRECVETLTQHSLCPAGALQSQLLATELVGELVNHRISEVREGALRGLLLHLEGGGGVSEALLEQLLGRVKAETEPPVAQLVMQVFTRYDYSFDVCASRILRFNIYFAFL